LKVRNGPLAGQSIELTGELVIGRERADLVIEDAKVSRRHVAVRVLSGSLEVEDLGSSNGTFVDGNRITQPTRIGAGARIRIGTTEFEVEDVLPVGQTRIGTAADSSLIAEPQVTRARPIADPQATRVRPIADPQAARARAAPAAPAQGPATAAHPPPAHPSPAPAPVPVGEFAPPSSRRSRGLASRSWVPVVLSFGTVVLVAIALVIYFASQ
jgi:predicted component of type VI protein secretion system